MTRLGGSKSGPSDGRVVKRMSSRRKKMYWSMRRTRCVDHWSKSWVGVVPATLTMTEENKAVVMACERILCAAGRVLTCVAIGR